MICLHKHDDYCDITTFEDSAKYYSVLICIECGGLRYEHWGVSGRKRIWE